MVPHLLSSGGFLLQICSKGRSGLGLQLQIAQLLTKFSDCATELAVLQWLRISREQKLDLRYTYRGQLLRQLLVRIVHAGQFLIIPVLVFPIGRSGEGLMLDKLGRQGMHLSGKWGICARCVQRVGCVTVQNTSSFKARILDAAKPRCALNASLSSSFDASASATSRRQAAALTRTTESFETRRSV